MHEPIRIRATKYNWTQTLGPHRVWKIGDQAIFTAGRLQYQVTIDSELMTHVGAPGPVYEVIFQDGSGRYAVLAGALAPIDTIPQPDILTVGDLLTALSSVPADTALGLSVYGHSWYAPAHRHTHGRLQVNQIEYTDSEGTRPLVILRV
jgi:hypothetical protein